MREKGLIKQIAKENRIQISHIIVGIMALILGCFHVESTIIGDTTLVPGIVLIVCATVGYYRKYNRIWRTNGDIIDVQSGRFRNTKLLTVLKSHSFSAHRYYVALRKRFLLFQIAGSILLLSSYFITKGTQPLNMAIIILTVPVAIGYLYENYAEYVLTHRKNAALSNLFSFFESSVNVIGLLLAGLCALIFCLFCMGILVDERIINGYDNNIPVRVENCTGVLIFFVVIVVVLWMESMLSNSFFSEVLLLKMRSMFSIRLILGGLVIILFCVYTFVGSRNYIVLTDENFMITRSGESTEYTLDNVTEMDIYAGKDDTLQAKLTFDDGKSEELFTGTCSDTEGWTEKYYSDYNYVAHLVEKFVEKGVPCTLRDVDVLREDVSALDQECQEGFEKIVSALGKMNAVTLDNYFILMI